MPALKPVLLCMAALVLFGACGSEPAPSTPESAPSSPVAEVSASEFQAPSFELPSLEGETVALEDLRGRVLVVHFGASWCPFCRAEDPHLEALYQGYRGRGVQALVVNVGEEDEAAARWKREAGFSFPMLLDRDGAVSARYAPPDAQPDLPRHEVMVASNLIIDRDGRVRYMSLLDTRTFDAQLVELKDRLNEILEEV